MNIVKLGGSVITDKTKEQTFKQTIMDNLSAEIKKANKEIIIVHGAGSFGHILANKYDLNEGYKKDEQKQGFSLTLEMVQNLSNLVLKSLCRYNIPAVSIPPHSIFKLNDHNLEEVDWRIFKDYLEKGFIPVTYGDVVLDKSLGFSICSGDLLVLGLSEYFKPKKVIFVIDEEGLYSSNPKIDKNAEFIDSITLENLNKLRTTKDKHADVTGGMGGKINIISEIAKLGIDTVLVNGNKPNRLFKVLVDEETKKSIIYGEGKT